MFLVLISYSHTSFSHEKLLPFDISLNVGRKTVTPVSVAYIIAYTYTVTHDRPVDMSTRPHHQPSPSTAALVTNQLSNTVHLLSPSHHPTHVGSTLSSPRSPPLSSSITPSHFQFRLKTHLFLKSFNHRLLCRYLVTHWTDLTDSRPDRFLLLIGLVLVLVLG